MKHRYVIVTPARNEEKHIERTLTSVISQTKLPVKWVIVSDGSIDRTDSIVAGYARKYPFISLIRTVDQGKASFASKARAFCLGKNQLKSIDYEFIGNLDADISFDVDYYARIIAKFKRDQTLGLIGGIIIEQTQGENHPQRISMNSVAGAIQIFRKQCFERIGGYLPLEYGGIDAAAEIMVRMHGWKVKTFPNIEALHHRPIDTEKHGRLHARLREGIRFYLLGYHPIFFAVRSLYRAMEKPYIVGSILRLWGYLFSCLKRPARPVSDKFINYLRSEQIQRIKKAFGGC